MTKKQIFLVPAFVLAFLFCRAAGIYAFECNGKFISEGIFRDEVLQQCGPPSSNDTWQEERFVDGYIRDYGRLGGHQGARSVLVTIDRWTFNLGPNRFTQILTFENGKLIRIKSGGTGY